MSLCGRPGLQRAAAVQEPEFVRFSGSPGEEPLDHLAVGLGRVALQREHLVAGPVVLVVRFAGQLGLSVEERVGQNGFALAGAKETKVDSLLLPVGLRGPMTSPAVSLDDKALQDARAPVSEWVA